MSGYAGDPSLLSTLPPDSVFLQKPVTAKELARAVVELASEGRDRVAGRG